MEDAIAWIDVAKSVCLEAISLPGAVSKTQEKSKLKSYFSPDGRLLFVVRAEIAQVMDVSTGRFLALPIRCTSSIESASFHPSELIVAVGTSKGTVEVWDLDSALPEQLAVFTTRISEEKPTAVTNLSWTSSGTHLVGCFGDLLKALHFDSRTLSLSSELTQSSKCISCMRLTDSGHLVIAGMIPTPTISALDLTHPSLALSERAQGASQTPLGTVRQAVTPQEPEPTAAPAPVEESTEAVTLLSLIKEAQETRSSLFTRLSALRAVRALAAPKGTFSALLAAVARQPASIRSQLVVDLLSGGTIELSSLRTVDDAAVLLDLLNQCLQSSVEDHVTIAMEWIKVSFKPFGTACADNFTNIRRQLHALSTKQTPVASQAKSLFLALSAGH